MKKIIFVLAILSLMTSLSFAETIYLKNGSVVKGTVLEKTDDQIEVDVNGMTMTYYADEIERIDGGAAAPAVSKETPKALELETVSQVPLSEPLSSESQMTEPSSESFTSDTGNESLSKKDLILKYMEVTGAKANMQKTFEDIINAAAADKKAALRQVLNINDIIDQLVPVYDKHFTSQDLQELIAFYESPVARKLFQVEPLLLKDVMETSRKYLEGKIE